MQFTQSVYVSLAHRYWQPAFTEERNRTLYGAQASAEGVGGNWRLEAIARADGGPDPDLYSALALLKAEVDHRCLWLDLEQFASRPSTLETVAVYLAQKLFALPGDWEGLRVQESERVACLVREDAPLNLEIRERNLTLTIAGTLDPESGLLVPRPLITRAVNELFRDFDAACPGDADAFAQRLFAQAQAQVKGLVSLQVDLGRHGYLRVESST